MTSSTRTGPKLPYTKTITGLSDDSEYEIRLVLFYPIEYVEPTQIIVSTKQSLPGPVTVQETICTKSGYVTNA